MLDFKQLETCLKDKRFVDGLQEINKEISYIKETNTLSYVKNGLLIFLHMRSLIY